MLKPNKPQAVCLVTVSPRRQWTSVGKWCCRKYVSVCQWRRGKSPIGNFPMMSAYTLLTPPFSNHIECDDKCWNRSSGEIFAVCALRVCSDYICCSIDSVAFSMKCAYIISWDYRHVYNHFPLCWFIDRFQYIKVYLSRISPMYIHNSSNRRTDDSLHCQNWNITASMLYRESYRDWFSSSTSMDFLDILRLNKLSPNMVPDKLFNCNGLKSNAEKSNLQ